jgi:hypothetical protein
MMGEPLAAPPDAPSTARALSADVSSNDFNFDGNFGKRSDEYELSVIAKNLKVPYSIVSSQFRAERGLVYFSQIPEPGVGGGSNTVSVLSVPGGEVKDLDIGDPEPSQLAHDGLGNLYWTCTSAGVIVKRTPQGATSVIAMNLDMPSGIAVDRMGTTVYFTEVPTPGVSGSNGGKNAISKLDLQSMEITQIDFGDPDPVDIAVTENGDLYWTCRSAGVIVRYEAATGSKSVILSNLMRPMGIASDRIGNRLYFTEVPTPGVNGDDGGMNRVSRYDVATMKVVEVNFGDPEPTDVAVGLDGTVYWTCTVAGVIVQAKPIPGGNIPTPPPMLEQARPTVASGTETGTQAPATVERFAGESSVVQSSNAPATEATFHAVRPDAVQFDTFWLNPFAAF